MSYRCGTFFTDFNLFVLDRSFKFLSTHRVCTLIMYTRIKPELQCLSSLSRALHLSLFLPLMSVVLLTALLELSCLL